MGRKTAGVVALEQLRDSQEEVALAATRAEKVQEVMMRIEEDLQRPCNLKTHRDSRYCPVHPLLQSLHESAGVFNQGARLVVNWGVHLWV